MVAEPHILMHQLSDVDRQFFTGLATALQQDSADNADGALSMLLNLGEILLEVCRYVFHVSGILLPQLFGAVFHQVLQVFQQLARHLAEIDHKIQRILYFVGDAGAEQPQGGHLFLLLQLLLQVFHLLFQAF